MEDVHQVREDGREQRVLFEVIESHWLVSEDDIVFGRLGNCRLAHPRRLSRRLVFFPLAYFTKCVCGPVFAVWREAMSDLHSRKRFKFMRRGAFLRR